MNKTLKLLLFLGIVSAISGLSIGFVNNLVAPIIASNDNSAEKENLELIFPGAEFASVDYTDDTGYIVAIYEAVGEGYAVKLTGVGFNASEPIVILAGFDNDGKIFDIRTLSQQETNGFGSRCFEDENIASAYLGRGLDETVDMISGATFTSTAMRNMLSAAQAAIKEIR